MTHTIDVFYSPQVSLGAKEWISLSKPAKVMNCVQEESACVLNDIAPITQEELCLAHDPKFVARVCSLGEPNGFGDCRPDVLQQVLYANGAFVQASHRARDVGVAFAPVSGFHHAGYNFTGGFCTFNGLMVAAQSLLQRDDTQKVLILDFDGHFGNGTQDIIETLRLEEKVTHLTRYRGFEDSPTKAVARALSAIDACPDIVLLQAGADSYTGDPFGAGYFDRQQWIDRDRRIFERCKALSVPVVWNLAGGYDGNKTTMLHYETWRTAIDVYCPHKIPALLA